LQRGAAFFDLDKTLMAGSSGMQFARVASQRGIVSRRQLASWGFEHLRYRLRGTTDERTGGRYGLQTICEGGGTANATIIERL
jgi:hypothetical protein